jgi:hypothetical protein
MTAGDAEKPKDSRFCRLRSNPRRDNLARVGAARHERPPDLTSSPARAPSPHLDFSCSLFLFFFFSSDDYFLEEKTKDEEIVKLHSIHQPTPQRRKARSPPRKSPKVRGRLPPASDHAETGARDSAKRAVVAAKRWAAS